MALCTLCVCIIQKIQSNYIEWNGWALNTIRTLIFFAGLIVTKSDEEK